MRMPWSKPLGGGQIDQSGNILTPKQVAERKAIAEALMAQAGDTSPVGHWTAALNRGLQGISASMERGAARSGEEAGLADFRAKMGARKGGASPVAAALAGSGGGGGAYAPPAEAAAIREGLIARGLPEHIADGFIMNFQDESGLNPGINEISPIVPGSRGGFGLYQLTGPRRTAYESFAAERGVEPSDTDAQLDWLMYELQGPEAKAAQSIFAAQNAGEAGAAIVNNFLRPAEEHRTSRASRYLGGSGVGSYPSASNGNVSQIAELLAHPWAAEAGAAPVLEAEMDAQIQAQAAEREMAMRQQDPMYQAQLQAQLRENERAMQPQADKVRYEVMPNGELVAINETQGAVQGMGNYAPAPEAASPQSPIAKLESDLRNGLITPEQYQAGLTAIDKSGVSVTTNLGGDKFADTAGANDANRFNEASVQGMSAAQNMARIDRLESLLAQGPSGASAALQSLAGEYGIDFGSVGPLQAATALINQMVPEQRPAGSGPMSDRDIELFKSSLPRLVNSAEGNALILNTIRGIAQYDMQIADIADRALLPSDDPNYLSRGDAKRLMREVQNPLAGFGKDSARFGTPESAAKISGDGSGWVDMGDGIRIQEVK